MTPEQLAALIASGLATDEQMRTVGFEFVERVKSNADVVQHRMFSAPAILKGVDDDTRTMSWVASTEAVDRMGDIISVKGWDLAPYRKNPIILFQHNSDWPIGTAKVSKGELPGGKKALFADVTFASADASPLAEQVYQLAKAKVLRGNSVGFIARQTRRPESEDERTALGLGQYGILFEKSELLEDSIVSVPANPEAVRLGLKSLVQRGELSQELADVFVHEAMGREPSEWFDNVRRSIFDLSSIGDSLRTILDAEGEDPSDDEGGEPETQTGPEGASLDEPESKGVGSEEQEPTLTAAALDKDFVEALKGLVEAQTEQVVATRQLVDSVNDLSRKVISLNVASAKGSGTGDESGDEEIDPDELRLVGAAIERLADSIKP